MNLSLKQNNLPRGWTLAELRHVVKNPKKDIVDGPFGSNLKANEYTDSGIPVLKIQNIKANQFIDKNIKCIKEKKAKELHRHSFKSGDLIITKLGYPLGLCCKVPETYNYGVIVADLIRLRPSPERIFDKYLTYAINGFSVQNQFKAITKGTTRPRVNLTIVRNIKIPYPPLPEQHGIVAKIEEMFSELDSGIENLKKAREQLKTYRQAVLKYAFEGKFTNQVENNELPKNWKIQKLGECLDIVSGNTPKGINDIQNSGKIPFYKVGDMNTPGNEVYMKEANLKLTQDEVSLLKVKLFPKGTVIFPKRGGAILTNKKRILSSFSGFDLNLMGAIPNENIDGLYLYYWFQKLNLSKIYDGSNVPQINRKNIAPLDIPIPPINEQQAIISEIESRLSVCDKIEQTIEDSFKKAEALRQSILKKAFEGELTKDWREKHPELISGENSAEKLLEKIKVEKALAAGRKKPQSKKTKKK